MSIEEIHQHIAITGQAFPKVYGLWAVEDKWWYRRRDGEAMWCLIPHPLAPLAKSAAREHSWTSFRVAVMPVDGSEPTEFLTEPTKPLGLKQP